MRSSSILFVGVHVRKRESSPVKKIGCSLTVLGVLLVVLSGVLFYTTIVNALRAHQTETFELPIGKTFISDYFTVNTSRACVATVTLGIKSDSVQEEQEFGDRDYKLRYRFPVSYTVEDETAQVIIREDTWAAWDTGTRFCRDIDVTSTGGSGTIEHQFRKFNVQPPGRVRVEARIDPDSRYLAQLTFARLNVYARVSRHTKYVVGGLAALFGGGGLFVIGMILVAIGFIGPKASETSKKVEQGTRKKP